MFSALRVSALHDRSLAIFVVILALNLSPIATNLVDPTLGISFSSPGPDGFSAVQGRPNDVRPGPRRKQLFSDDGYFGQSCAKVSYATSVLAIALLICTGVRPFQLFVCGLLLIHGMICFRDLRSCTGNPRSCDRRRHSCTAVDLGQDVSTGHPHRGRRSPFYMPRPRWCANSISSR